MVFSLWYNYRMNTSKILTIVFVVAVLCSVGFAYYRYMIQGDFLVKYQTPCDPSQGICFVYECDAAADECTGNPDEDTQYYSLIYRKASGVPECDPDESECDGAYTCQTTEHDCRITTCDEETATNEGVTCSNPADFLPEESIEDESSAGEGGEGLGTLEDQVPEIPAAMPEVAPASIPVVSTGAVPVNTQGE